MARLALYVGPMFSGKTTSVLAELDRYRYKNKKILLLKPKVDGRFSETHVCTHTGISLEAVSVKNLFDIRKLNPELYDVIAIDEAFMIKNIGSEILSLYAQDKIVLVSSLDLSSSLEPFPDIALIMPYATEIYKCSSICGVTECYEDAHFTFKFEGAGEKASGEIEVGGSEMYEPRCYKHHPQASML